MTPDFVASLSVLAGDPTDGRDLRDGLDRVVRLADETVPGAAAASITLIRSGRPSSPASSRSLALTCDRVQYDLGDGPCLHAARDAVVVQVDDVRDEQRFASYPETVAELGVLSSISVPLAVRAPLRGAMNVYAADPHALGAEALVLAHAFAAHAAVVIAASDARQMEEAMATRAVIEQAKGIIMSQRRCTPADAFQLLVRASTRSNRKLREIAADVVEAAQLSAG